ncbi:hypothetical protein AVEN_91332-1 [Araneus ventricosus]|uniref:Uncharacterized protein n=1 Tax=Araneus ventricosus TaxID=182803 RepID=A0A4Y2L9G6_ARAVE|nr:hypothetical protein AVEN_91332-1 [Araneus ventricosus]
MLQTRNTWTERFEISLRSHAISFFFRGTVPFLRSLGRNGGQMNDHQNRKFLKIKHNRVTNQQCFFSTVNSYGSMSRLRRRPRWPSGRVSASVPEGSKFKTRFHERFAVYRGLVHV